MLYSCGKRRALAEGSVEPIRAAFDIALVYASVLVGSPEGGLDQSEAFFKN